MTKEERIILLKVIDNFGQTANIDLFALSDEEFNELEAEIFQYASKRADAWDKAYKNNSK